MLSPSAIHLRANDDAHEPHCDPYRARHGDATLGAHARDDAGGVCARERGRERERGVFAASRHGCVSGIERDAHARLRVCRAWITDVRVRERADDVEEWIGVLRCRRGRGRIAGEGANDQGALHGTLGERARV